MKNRAEEITRLHTTEELRNFAVQASDGTIGTITDLALSSTEWRVRYLIVDPADWLPGKRVIVPVSWIHEIAWQKQQVYVTLSREQVQDSPDLESLEALDREYEERFYAYYQRHPYWLEESAVDEASWESFPASDPPARW